MRICKNCPLLQDGRLVSLYCFECPFLASEEDEEATDEPGRTD